MDVFMFCCSLRVVNQICEKLINHFTQFQSLCETADLEEVSRSTQQELS